MTCTGARSQHARRGGLTVIEVLVAIAILGIVAAAVLGTFSVILRLNRDASTEVDYSRVVRSTMERIRLDWSLPVVWDAGTVATIPLANFVALESDGACTGAIVPDPVVSTVKVVRITCAGAGVATQEYELEFGRP